jgi:phosphoribosylamine--glycine ligase
MVSSQDHKRVFDGDTGLNTGGMGAYSPAPIITPAFEKEIIDTIMRPVIEGMKSEGIKYKGILYAGLMIKNNKPSVLEFNCRLGDPETQPVLSRLSTDFLDICLALTDGKLSELDVKWKPEAAVCVVLAAKGYPGSYPKGDVIEGLDTVKKTENVTVFHAGTAFKNNNIVTNGGRVLGVTALGEDIRAARDKAYDAINNIHFKGMHYRKDIAHRALKYSGQNPLDI